MWMGVRVRRSLAAGSGRWLLYPVVAVMAAAAVGGAVETVGLASDQHSYAMPGQLYDVGGYRLHLNCTGSGSPTVVLQSGLGEFSAAWARIAPGRRRHHPGLRLRPRRAGLERGRAARAGRPAGRRRSAHPAEPRRRGTARTCWSGTRSAATTR